MSKRRQVDSIGFRKPPKSALYIVVLAALGAYAVTTFLSTPAKSEVVELTAEKNQLRQELSQLDARIAGVQRGDVDSIVDLYAQAAATDELLPESADTSTFERGLPDSIREHGLTLGSLRKGQVMYVGSGTLGYVPFTVDVTGQLDQILNWIEDVKDAERLITVASAPLGITSNGTFSMSAKIHVWHSTTPELKLDGVN